MLLCFLFALTTFNLNNSNFFNLFFKVENVQYNKTLFVEESLKSEARDLLINKNLFLLDKKKNNRFILSKSLGSKSRI